MAEIFKAKVFGVDGFEKPMVVKQILPQLVDRHNIAVSQGNGDFGLVDEHIDEFLVVRQMRQDPFDSHDLLESLSDLAGATELNPMTVGEAALRVQRLATLSLTVT